MVFNSSSAGVDRRAQEYIGELVHELLTDAGIDPCAFGWELVVDWDEEQDCTMSKEMLEVVRRAPLIKMPKDGKEEWVEVTAVEELEDGSVFVTAVNQDRVEYYLVGADLKGCKFYDLVEVENEL
jgi:hypothetical protein